MLLYLALSHMSPYSSVPMQLYVAMASESYELPRASPDEHRRAEYLLTCLNRLSTRVEELEAVGLAVLMQHQLGHLPAHALLEILQNLERLCWMWVLCGGCKTGPRSTSKSARTKPVIQVPEACLPACCSPASLPFTCLPAVHLPACRGRVWAR